MSRQIKRLNLITTRRIAFGVFRSWSDKPEAHRVDPERPDILCSCFVCAFFSQARKRRTL